MTGLASAYTTHLIHSPSDQLVVGVCEQVGCQRYARGWDMCFDEATEEGQLAARIVRSGKTERTYRELGVNAAGLTVFRFDAYQRCFENHQTRPELYVVRKGTPETNLGLIRRHEDPQFWVEDYRETLDRRLTSRQRG